VQLHEKWAITFNTRPPPPLPLSRTSFSKGEISHFFQRGNWEKWKKNALSRGVKKQKCASVYRGFKSLPEGSITQPEGSIAFQRGKNPQKQRYSTGGFWILNVIAQSK
jgi:hypothetical protein